ncbi:MAG: hypothetical protein Q8K99_11970 [Actinomycetota bacterium]|nr:hypothetical protein [Actinomycetota bacterium]
MPAVWWVNQTNPQYTIDRTRGYRWSPSKTKTGGVREAWRCLEDMAQGDIWICWSSQSIDALGLVNRPPEPSRDWPVDQANQDLDDYPDHAGYRVFFDLHPLDRPISAGEIPDEWKRKAGPFRANLWVKLSSVEPVDLSAADELREMFADRWPVGSPWGVDAPPATAPRATRYWLSIHTPDSWERFLAGDIDVVTSKHKTDSIQRGDIFINFVSGDGARWVSAEEVVSDVRPLRGKPYQDYESQWEWQIRPLTPRLALDEGIVVRPTTGRLELFRGYERNWGVRVRKSGTELTEHDAELIIEWIDPLSEGTR